MEQCSPGELGTCMVSLARMGDVPPSSLLDKAAAAMRSNLTAYDPKVWCDWCWTAAVCEKTQCICCQPMQWCVCVVRGAYV